MNSSPNNNNNNSTTRNTTMSSTSNNSNNSNSNNSNNKTGSSSNLSSLQPESLNIITGNMNTIPPVSRNTNASDEYNVTSPTSLAVAVRESMLDTSNTNSNQARNTTTNSRMSSSKQLRDSAGATISDNTRVTSNLSSRFSSRPFFSSRRSASELELHEKAEINSTPTLPDVTLRDSSAIASSSSSHRSRSKTGSKRSIFRDTVSFLARDSTQYTIPENTPTTCEGYLTKRGHVVTNWKTRYFVLKGDILIYYNDENSANNGEKPLGQVKVEKVSTWSGETNGFMFYTGKQIPYYVYAASEFECSKWIKAMKDFIVQQDPVDCEGYLTKRGHLVPSYRLRYFVLRGMSLKYYTDRDSFLANQSAVAEMEVTNVAKWNGEKTGIVFRTSTGNLLYLYADSVQDQMKWLQCLSNVARRNSITSTGTAALAPSSNGNGGLSMGENVIWSGYLKKQGHKRKSWKKRYFVLRSTGLSYYPDHESAVTKGIAIAEVIVQEVQVWDGAGPYGLMIMTTDQIPYYFLAENERDRMQWISHMRSSVSSSQNTNLTDRPEVGPPSSLLSQEKKSTCPRCQAVLTGTRFCGACGHKTRNTLTENDPVLATEITTNEEADPVVTENDTTETPFDELEALSEGARTLLLAVMQTPEGINIGDTTGAFPSRMSSRRVDKRGSSGYLNNIEDLEKAIQETEEELETKQTADEESKKASDKSQDLELSKEIDEEKIILPETDTKSPVLLHKRTNSKHADVKMEKDSIDNGNDPQSQKKNGANDHAVTETAPKPDPIDKTLEQRGNQVAANKVERRTSTDAVRSKQSFDGKATENSKKTGRKSDHGEDEEEASFYDTVTLDTRGIAVLSQPEYKNPAESKPTLPPTSKLSKRDLYTVFEKELEFSPMYVPSADSPVRCRIYGSMNYMSAASVIFFLSDSGPLGLWKVESGTENAVQLDNPRCMFSYLSRAQEEGYGILLSNPYTNSVTVYEEGGIERIVSIPKSSTPTEHVEFLWENMLLPCKGMISIIAYGQGGALTKYLLEKNESVARSRIHRIGFIESLHSIEGNESPGFLELIGRRAIHWESSNVEAVGGQMVESQTRYGCVCLSSGSITKKENGKPPDIFSNTEEGIFSFLKANPDRPGMTAIVGYIRAKLRRKRLSIRPGNKQPVSGVVVLGETRLENEDSMNQENSENLEEATPTKRQGTDDNEIKSKSSNPKSAYYLPRNNSSSRTVASSKQYPTMSVKDFELQKIVGQGGFGKVYLAKKITEPQLNRYFAMKVLKKNHVLASGLVNTTMAERHILTEISHPFIVKLHYAFQSENKLYLVMDYLPGGSLALHLRRKRKFSEEYAVFYAAEIASAMAHLHYVNIVYRDAKLENVLMDHEGHVRITDFGLSKVGVSGLQGATTFCGTAAYIAPELLQGNSYGKAADWWSFGILLYEMIGGKPPYYHRNRDIMFQTILKQEWVTFSPSFSDSAVSLIRGLLTREPTKRLGSGSRGADEILTHPFFNSIDWENLLAKKIQPPFSPGVGEYDTYYAPRHLLNNEITPGDREASLVIKKPNQKNDFDGFSFVGRSPQLNS